MKTFIASLAFALLLGNFSQCDAAAINFKGTLTAGGSGTAVLGTTFPRNFSLSVVFNEQTPLANFGSITGGTFSALGPTLNFSVTGGNIIVNEGGTNDTATFLVNVAGPATGQLSFVFSKNAIVNSNGTLANIAAIVQNNQTSFAADFSGVGAGVYSGIISDVPEPSSCLALLGVVCGGAWRWRNSRKQAV